MSHQLDCTSLPRYVCSCTRERRFHKTADRHKRHLGQLVVAGGLVVGMVGFGFVEESEAVVVLFETNTGNTNTTMVGDTFTATETGLVADGVTFDATLTVLGSDDLTQNSNGLGVDGAGSTLVSDGEFLRFSMSISNEVGGAVNFAGFTEVTFESFGASDSGVLSIDVSEATGGDNFFTTTTGADTVDISLTLPTTFHAIASSGSPNTFRVTQVKGQFEAIPEPSTVPVLALLSLFLVFAKRRKLLRSSRRS